MPERPVVNSSPLIYLSKAGYLDLLVSVGSEIVVPEPVAREIQRRGPKDPTVRALDQAAWLQIEPVTTIPDIVQRWDLGLGEAAVLAWAMTHPEAWVIVDDQRGRNCAKSLGLKLRGTVGVVIGAKKKGLIAKARPVIEKLLLAGMYFSSKHLNQALALVDE